MNGFWQHFHFLHPWWLIALLLVPLLLVYLRRRGGVGMLSRLADADLLPHLLDRGPGVRRWPLALPALAALLVVLALAGPAWRRLPQPLYIGRAGQVVALSLSQRMLARDLSPDRLTRARYKVHALLDANRAGQNGLVAYAGHAFTVAPMTSDAHSLDDLLDALAPDTMPVPGNDAARAIRRGAKLLRAAGDEHGSLVLVTDSADIDAVAAARAAYAHGIRVSVLGVGTRKGAPVPLPQGGFLHNARGDIVMARRDDASLRRVAAAGGGRYVPMRADSADVQQLAAMLPRAAATRQHGNGIGSAWIDEGPWLLLPLVLLAALAFRRGWLLLLPMVLVPALTPARAQAPAAATSTASRSDRFAGLWQRPDQRAAEALAHGHAKQAMALARDPAWRGAAAYRAGAYKAAAKAFAAAHGADARYNEGNALARLGHYRQAIAAYDRALALEPGMADALANRRALRDWLRQHRHAPSRGSRNSPQSSGKHESGRGGDTDQREHQGNTHAGSSRKQGGSAGQSSGASRPSQGGGAGRHPAGGADQKANTTAAAHAGSDRKAAQQARKAITARMNRALQGHRKAPASYALGAQEGKHRHGKPALSATMREALQRVPDDPGGLLRRKFMLEYQRRQAAGPSGDSQ